MAFLGLRVPPETARLLSEIDVPGKKESRDRYHITLLFLGDNIDIKVLSKALEVTYAVTSETKPFTVQVNRVSSFPGGDDGVPIICPVNSDPLHDLRQKLADDYDSAGIEYSKRFPEYKPHVTLSYGEEAIEERRVTTVEWGAHELVLWGGDQGDGRLVITFPFALEPANPLARSAGRVARRWLAEMMVRSQQP